MSKAITKHLTIDIEYIDKTEISGILNTIKKQLNNGKNFNREKYGTSIYQYRKTLTSFPDYREEQINGKWCFIYESKINKK
jgi:hypothetical protein